MHAKNVATFIIKNVSQKRVKYADFANNVNYNEILDDMMLSVFFRVFDLLYSHIYILHFIHYCKLKRMTMIDKDNL